jgi:hypothetical protein
MSALSKKFLDAYIADPSYEDNDYGGLERTDLIETIRLLHAALQMQQRNVRRLSAVCINAPELEGYPLAIPRDWWEVA